MYESEAFLSRIDGIQFNLLSFFDPWHVSLVGLSIEEEGREREDFFFKKEYFNNKKKILLLVISSSRYGEREER